MKRLVASAAVFAFAGLSSVGLASSVGAQEMQEVDWDLSELAWGQGVDSVELPGSLSPDVAAPGETITVTGECNLARLSDPRHPHELRWALVEEGGFPGWEDIQQDPHRLTFQAIDSGVVDVPGEEEGYMWEASFQAPADPGNYQFVGVCVPTDLAGYPHCSIGLFARDLTLEVEDVPPVETTTTTAPSEQPETPEVAPPAVPVPGQPQFTG